MHDRDRRRDVREVERFLDGCVPAAYHGDGLVAIKEPITRGACRYAAPLIGFLRRQAQILCRCAGGDDECVAGVLGAVSR